MTYSHHCNSFFAGAQWWLMASSKFSHGLWSTMALSSQTVPNPPFLFHWKVPSLYLADRNKAYLNSNQLFLIQRELLFFIIDSCAFFSISLSWSHFSPFLCSAPTPAPLFFLRRWGLGNISTAATTTKKWCAFSSPNICQIDFSISIHLCFTVKGFKTKINSWISPSLEMVLVNKKYELTEITVVGAPKDALFHGGRGVWVALVPMRDS